VWHTNKFSRKSFQKCGLSPFFHWTLYLCDTQINFREKVSKNVDLVHFSIGHFIYSGTIKCLVDTIFWKKNKRFCGKFAQVVYGVRGWNDQILGPGGRPANIGKLWSGSYPSISPPLPLTHLFPLPIPSPPCHPIAPSLPQIQLVILEERCKLPHRARPPNVFWCNGCQNWAWRWVEGLAKWVNIFTDLRNLQWQT